MGGAKCQHADPAHLLGRQIVAFRQTGADEASSNPAKPGLWGRALLFAPPNLVRIHPGSRRHGSRPCRGAICLTGSRPARLVETVRSMRARTWWPNRRRWKGICNRLADVLEVGVADARQVEAGPTCGGSWGPMTSRLAWIRPVEVFRVVHAQRRLPNNRKEAAAEMIRLEPPFVRGGSDGIRTRGLGLDRAAC